MNPSQLDESLLTAYLDDELSEKERLLVEEQLKVNEHWKQLLNELQSVQNLIRELPTPLLTRSIENAPWKEPTNSNAVVRSTGAERVSSNRRPFSKTMLSLAASLMLVGIGVFAWMRSGDERNEIAKVDQTTAIEKSAVQTAPQPERESLNSPAKNMETTIGSPVAEQMVDPSIELRLEAAPKSAASESDLQERGSIALRAAKPMLKHSAPLPTPPVVSLDSTQARSLERMNSLEATGIAPSADSYANLANDLPRPVETLWAVRRSDVQDGLLRQQSQLGIAEDKKDEKPETSGIVKSKTSAAGEYFFESQPLRIAENISSLQFVPNQRYEFQVMRSDLPLMVRRLHELGWEIQGDGVWMGNESKDLSSMRRLSELSFDQEHVPASRPPTLTGAMVEPTDWIRIAWKIGPSPQPSPPQSRGRGRRYSCHVASPQSTHVF